MMRMSRIGRPSRPFADAGVRTARRGRGSAASAGAAAIARAAMAGSAARSSLPPARRAESLTCQLRLAGQRVAFDQILERAARLRVPPELLLRQSELVERGRHLVALRPSRFDL